MHSGITAVQSRVKQDLHGFPSISPLAVWIGYRHRLPLHHGKAVMQGFGCLSTADVAWTHPGLLLCFTALQLETALSKAGAVRSSFALTGLELA